MIYDPDSEEWFEEEDDRYTRLGDLFGVDPEEILSDEKERGS